MKKQLILFTTIIFILNILQLIADDTQPLQGQAKIDSLLKELPNAKNDTNHVNLLYYLCFEFGEINPNKGIEYGELGLKLSKKIKWDKGEANIYNSLGVNYISKSNYPKALEYYNKSLKMFEDIRDKNGIAKILGNIGSIYIGQTDYPKALEYFSKALKIYEELGDKRGIALNLGNIGLIYNSQYDYPKALEYYGKSLKIKEELGNKNGIASILGNMGSIYYFQYDYPKALECLSKSLKIYIEQGNKSGIAGALGNIGNIYIGQTDYPKALEYFSKALKMNEEIENRRASAINLGNIGELYLKLSQDSVKIQPSELNEFVSLNKEVNLNRSIDYLLNTIKIFEDIRELHGRSYFLKVLADAYKLKGNYKKWGEALEEHHIIKDSVFNEENKKKIDALTTQREEDLKQAEIEKQKLLIAEQEKREQIIVYSSIGALILVLIILGLVINSRSKSNKLLHNVLPKAIADRLKKKEHPISDHFDQASIIFIDIVGFTSMSKDADPRRIVEALNKMFTIYDGIAHKYGMEKIKTIGDSYMAAAGIPIIQKDNTHRAAQMALEVKKVMADYHTADGTKINVRIGVDCGPVVAGVIGEHKFIYDLWSDAVNTASRMESTGEAGHIQTTQRFKDAVSLYQEYEYQERGEVMIKGIGTMKTYFLES